MLKVNDRNTRTSCEICFKLTIKAPYFTPCSSVSVVNFEQANGSWELFRIFISLLQYFLVFCSTLSTLKSLKKHRFSMILLGTEVQQNNEKN